MSNTKTELMSHIDALTHPGLKAACQLLAQMEPFWTTTAACRRHQAYQGGLADHTLEVMQLALAAAEATSLKPIVNRDTLIAACFAHDVGKIWDYQELPPQPGSSSSSDPKRNKQYGYTRHRWTVRHLVRSYHEWMRVAEEVGPFEGLVRITPLDIDLVEEVAHCILAHHGRLEWGSPVEPLTAEALLLHQADMMSAHFTEDIKANPFRQTGRTDWKKL